MTKKSQEIREHKTLLKSLDKTQRRDLALHLYVQVLLHGLNPRFPTRHWDSWPLKTSLVPDPQTEWKYADCEELHIEKEIHENQIRKRLNRKRKLAGTGARSSESEESDIPDSGSDSSESDSFESERDSSDEIDQENEDATEGTNVAGPSVAAPEVAGLRRSKRIREAKPVEEEEPAFLFPDPVVKPLPVQDEHEQEQEETSDEERISSGSDMLSDSNSDSDSESGSGSESPEIPHVVPTQIKFTKRPSDYRANLYFEMRALLLRTIRNKINKLELQKGQGMTTDVDHIFIDDMAKRLCAKVDTMFQHLSNMRTHVSRRNVPVPALTWQDILLADLHTDTTIPLHSKQDFYDRLEKLLLVPPYNFQFNELAPYAPQEFTYKKYVESQGERKRVLLRDKIKQKKEVDYKKTLFRKVLEAKELEYRMSVNKGDVIGQPKSLGKDDVPNFVVFHGGLRVSENTYINKFQS